jgi:hypothetical protein
MPSRLISRNTVVMLHASSASAGKTPTADSNARRRRIPAWMIAGRGRRRAGRGGTPIEIDDRERKTVVW